VIVQKQQHYVTGHARLAVNITHFPVPATESQSLLYTWSVQFSSFHINVEICVILARIREHACHVMPHLAQNPGDVTELYHKRTEQKGTLKRSKRPKN